MINFLSSPEDFNSQVRFASMDKRTLAKIASVQIKYATSFQKLGFWAFNAIKSGVMRIKGIFEKFVGGFHKITKMLFLSTPVISGLTSYFRKIAYKRLLGAMYDSWKLGLQDSAKLIKRTPKGLSKYLKERASRLFKDGYVKSMGSFYMRDPFYEEYLLGYEGKSHNELRKRAKEVVERDIGTRTLSEASKFVFDSFNVFSTLHQLIKEGFYSEAYTGRELLKNPGPGAKVMKSRTSSWQYVKGLLQVTFWLFILAFKVHLFAFYGGLIPLGILGMFYYAPGEALFKKSEVSKEFNEYFNPKIFKKEYIKVLEREIPIRDVFIRDSLGEISNPSSQELEEIKDVYND